MKFSVVIPSYNHRAYIEGAIDSILIQQVDVEIIVIDGGSSDGTVDVLKKYGNQISYWVSEKDQGQSDALNKGFAVASGDVLSWLCADDLYLPQAMKKVEEFFSQNPEEKFVYGNGYRISKDGQVIEPIICDIPPRPEAMVNYNYVFSTAAFWKADVWRESGGYVDTTNNWTMDWELFIRMSCYAKLNHITSELACLRSYEETKTSIAMNKFNKKRQKEIAQISRRYGGIFCYNSIAYCLIRFASIVEVASKWPRPLRSLLFRIFYFPLSLLKKQDSMLTGKAFVRSERV